ncbi:MAG TPA: DUF1385 domain-containing protein [candidate division Zixibacteria bacterium]|jgi:uncharacterized protein YqhQ
MTKLAEKEKHIGGQAVIEGVMMRSSIRVSTAVRKQSGEIVVKNEDYTPLSKRYKLLNIPVIRGVVSFVEMLIIGIKSLNFSADVAVEEIEEKEGKNKNKSRSKSSRGLMLALAVILALGLGILIFFFLPLFFSSLLRIKREALAFNLVAGIIRVAMFLIYVWAISLFKDFKRIFEYHGAEHKSIYAYEADEDLTFEKVKKFSTRHPRCGTSFILIVAIFAIFIYSISDTIYILIAGTYPPLLKRFLLHFTLLPLVAGGSYELLKLSGKTKDNRITRTLSAPGIWLQKITTKEPDESQLEVAIVALESALGKTISSNEGDKKISEKV